MSNLKNIGDTGFVSLNGKKQKYKVMDILSAENIVAIRIHSLRNTIALDIDDLADKKYQLVEYISPIHKVPLKQVMEVLRTTNDKETIIRIPTTNSGGVIVPNTYLNF